MLLKHIADLGLLDHDPNSRVLDAFPLSVRRSIISEVSGHIFSTLRQCEGSSNVAPTLASAPTPGAAFTTRAHLLWAMEVLGSGLCLPLEDILLTANCISIYCTWLLEPSSRPPIMNTALSSDEPVRRADSESSGPDANLTFYFKIMFCQLSCFFEFPSPSQMAPAETEVSGAARRKQPPASVPQELLSSNLHKKLECMKSVLLAFSYLSQDPSHAPSKREQSHAVLQPKMTCRGWDTLVRVLLGVTDHLLCNTEPALQISPTSDKIVDTLAEPALWTLFEVWCRAGIQDTGLWSRLQSYILRWTHRTETLLQWQSTVFGLTSCLLSLLYQNQGPGDVALPDRPHARFSITLSTISSLKLRPALSPSTGERTIVLEWPSLQYFYFAWYKFYFLLRDIKVESLSPLNYYCFVAGLQTIFGLFLKPSGFAPLSSAASFSALPYSFTGSSLSPVHDATLHHNLVSIAIGDWWKVIPSGNTLLELFGHWVHSAAIANTGPGLHRRSSLASDVLDTEQGRAESIAILIRLFNLKQSRQPFQAASVYRYYRALALCLSGLCGMPSILTSLFFCANDLWPLFYAGLPFLAGDFFAGIKRALPLLYSSTEKSDYRLRRLDHVTDEDYRRAIYKLLGQLLVLPGYYVDTLTPVSLNDVDSVADFVEAHDSQEPTQKSDGTGTWSQWRGKYQLKYIPDHFRVMALAALAPAPIFYSKQESDSSAILCIPFSRFKELVSELIMDALDNEDHSPNLRYLLNILNVWIHDQGRVMPDLIFKAILFLSLKLRDKSWSAVVNRSAVEVLRQWFPLIKEFSLSRQHDCFSHLANSLSAILLENWADGMDYTAKTADWALRVVRVLMDLLLLFDIASDSYVKAVQVLCQGAKLKLAKESLVAQLEQKSLIQQARLKIEKCFYFQLWRTHHGDAASSVGAMAVDVPLAGCSRTHTTSPTQSLPLSTLPSPSSMSTFTATSTPSPSASSSASSSSSASASSVPEDFQPDTALECQLSLQRLFEREEHVLHSCFSRGDSTCQLTLLERFDILSRHLSSVYIFKGSTLFSFLDVAGDEECVELCARDWYEERRWLVSWQWVSKSYLSSLSLHRERLLREPFFEQPDERTPPALVQPPLAFNSDSFRKPKPRRDADSLYARLDAWQDVKQRRLQTRDMKHMSALDSGTAIRPPASAQSKSYLSRLWTNQAGLLHPHYRQQTPSCPLSSDALEKVCLLGADMVLDLMALDSLTAKENISVSVYFASSGYCSLEEMLGMAKCDRDAVSLQAFHFYMGQLGVADERLFPDAVDGLAMSVYEDEKVRMSFYFPLNFNLSRFSKYIAWSNAYEAVRQKEGVIHSGQLFKQLEIEMAREAVNTPGLAFYLEGYMDLLSTHPVSLIWLESEEGMLALPNTLAPCSSSPSHLYLYILPLKQCHLVHADSFVDGLAKIRIVIVGPIQSQLNLARSSSTSNNFLSGPLLDGMLIRLESLAALIRATILSSHEFFSPDGTALQARRRAIREWILRYSKRQPHVHSPDK